MKKEFEYDSDCACTSVDLSDSNKLKMVVIGVTAKYLREKLGINIFVFADLSEEQISAINSFFKTEKEKVMHNRGQFGDSSTYITFTIDSVASDKVVEFMKSKFSPIETIK